MKKNKKINEPVLDYVAPVPLQHESQIAHGVGDWGNFNMKEKLLGSNQMSIMRNMVTFIDDNQWPMYKSRYQYSPNRFPNTFVFEYLTRSGKKEDRYWRKVAVGDGAEFFGTPTELTEEVKYAYNDYWGAIAGANFLSLFPLGHDHIVMALAHPTKSVGQRERMMESTSGVHYIRLIDSQKLRFVVREVMPWDEPVGGAVSLAMNIGQQDAEILSRLKINSRILMVDIGGAITSMTQLIVTSIKPLQLTPVYDPQQSPSFSVGIHEVMDNLRNKLATNKLEFEAMRDTIDDTMLTEGLLTGIIHLSGEPIKVEKEVEEAQYPLLQRLSDLYKSRLGSGRPFTMIGTTGGGMTIYHEQLKTKLWKHKFVYPALPDLSYLFRANMDGGAEMFQQYLEIMS